MKKSNRPIILLFMFSMLLAGCSGFNGVRKPLYDGTPVKPDEEAIAIYHETREITGDEKDYYVRNPFSPEITNPSLVYPNEEPVLLEEGKYVIGEDIPAGRATLIGNESVFGSENTVIHVGNLTIRDKEEEVYFENVFHSEYGPLVTQVDLIAGHTLEIIGTGPEITVFYSETLPEDPYILMDPPELLVNLERLDFQQPIIKDEESVRLTAGIYEVGEHLEPGIYEIGVVVAPHNTEMLVFHEGQEPRVFELITAPLPAEGMEELEAVEPESYPKIKLEMGDKIYPSLVRSLELRRVN